MYRLSMRSLSIETPRVLFDISRLVRSYEQSFGTGVDRIDLAIGLDLLKRFGSECHFVHAGRYGVCILPQDLGKAVLIHLQHLWNDDPSSVGQASVLIKLRLKYEPRIRSHFPPPSDRIVSPQTTYVVASHSGVGKIAGGMSGLDPHRKMQRLIYIHDLIPFEYPEYQRPEAKQQFSSFLKELTDTPVIAVSNSNDTDRRVKKFAAENAWQLAATDVIVPTLDFKRMPATPLTPPVSAFLENGSPYFVILGTIEPRKNHLLLLQIWRELSQRENPPRLCIIGKRGWENENVIDMLERCPAITDTVSEFADLSDFEVQTMLQHATALLFPSFAEGLGIPILEAAALGVPCVASDIPVFREIAPAGTTFLSPLDGAGWLAEIVSRAGDVHNNQMKDQS
ncbi:glycosyltransferase family 1 protein (plasmid) [Pararhizobium sp. A13]